MEGNASVVLKLCADLLRDLHDQGRFPLCWKVKLVDKDLGKLIWSHECFMQVPQKVVL